MPARDQNLQPGRYTVVPRTLIFLRRGESVLLMRGGPARSWAGLYNGVGGHIEKGEDPLTAALRELQEECGLQARLSLCGILINDTGGPLGVAVFIFTGETQLEEVQSSEEGQAEWVPLQRLPDLPLRFEDLPLLLPRVMAWRPGDAPFLARSWYDAGGHLHIEFAT